MELLGLKHMAWPRRRQPRPTWHEGLASSDPHTDAEHQALIARLADVYDVLAAPDFDHGRLRGPAEALWQVARQHFASEELLLDAPHIDAAHRHAHRLAHQGFLQRLEDMLQRAEAMPPDVYGELLEFLCRWLVNHIQRMDLELIAAAGADAPPQPA